MLNIHNPGNQKPWDQQSSKTSGRTSTKTSFLIKGSDKMPIPWSQGNHPQIRNHYPIRSQGRPQLNLPCHNMQMILCLLALHTKMTVLRKRQCQIRVLQFKEAQIEVKANRMAMRLGNMTWRTKHLFSMRCNGGATRKLMMTPYKLTTHSWIKTIRL